MIGTLDAKTPISSYQPSVDQIEVIKRAKDTYSQGSEILHRSWAELNNRSIIDDEDHGQMMFNAFVDTSVEDPNEAWKWRGTRSMARNKGIAMHAQLTAAYLIPTFIAQNDEDQIDRDFSDFMRDIVEWMTYPENSDYQSSFLNVVFGMMDSPVTYLGVEYCEVFQKIREKQKDGSYTTKEILDDVLSGFKAPVYRANQVLITNAYERNIQRHGSIIKRRYLEQGELEAKYGDHENWDYVNPGVRSLYSEDDGLFYDLFDNEHPTLVEECTYLNRRDDTEICFINGIYFGSSNVEDNPIRHRDNRGAPKYNVVPFGYNRIGRHFFYYKSMMNAMRWDNALYDAATEITANRAFLEAEMPVVFSGVDKVDTSVVFPGASLAIANENAKVTPLLPTSNLNPLFTTLNLTEQSMSDASLSDTQMGQLPQASQKAYSVAQAAQASKKIIAGVGKSLAESITQVGDLMKDVAINHITAPEVEELTGGKNKLKYKTFLLPQKNVGGKTIDKVVKFDQSLLGLQMTEDEMTTRNLRLLEDTGYPDNKHSIYLLNPEMFANFRYYAKADLKEMFPMNEEMSGALWQGLFPMLNQDPYISQEDLRRKLLRPYQAEDIVQKPQEQNPTQMGMLGGSPVGNMAVGKQLAGALPQSGGMG